MRTRASLLCALVLSSLGPGCILANLSPEERLRDAVVGYNDECRWNRLDLAVQRVIPPKRPDFYATHHRWGSDIQIADSDIVHVQTSGEDHEHAISYVTVQWYDQRTMLISQTVLEQTWDGGLANGYILMDETVRSGDPALLSRPEVPEGEASEGEAEAPSHPG